MSKADLRDELRRRYGRRIETPVHIDDSVTSPGGPAFEVEPERAFVLHAESGRTVITAPIREVAKTNETFAYITGRLVGADQPNRNNALWTSGDLQMAEHTVAGGPLNWLHDENHIIGCLLDGSFKEDASIGNHIESRAAVWSFLYPHETAVIERAAMNGECFYSMECISREVSCVGSYGCEQSFSYADYNAGRTCAHLKDRTSTRRFVDPIFQGAAIIVPPVSPGWANASVDLERQAAALADGHDYGVSQDQARDVAAAILRWANR